MKNIKLHVIIYWMIFGALISHAQNSKLKKGFDKAEYIEMLKISARQVDTPWTNVKEPAPENFILNYRSAVTGLKNRWDLWIANDGSTAVISIRGTTGDAISWMENFYAVMVPAKGKIKLTDTLIFSYQLAENPKAAVHAGWLIGLACLSQDILHKIDSCKKSGIRDFYIMGHSQGAAIAYLLTSHILHLQQTGFITKDLHFKTYCSAAPKPGNLYYAYDFEYATQNGSAVTVVNAADWVPELPFSIQTVKDFNNINPFTDAKKILNKIGFPKNIALKYMYSRLSKPPAKSTKRFQHIMGRNVYKMVKKTLPSYVQPTLYPSNNYVRTGGIVIILMPDSNYYSIYPDDKKKLFNHHFPGAYLYLAEKIQ